MKYTILFQICDWSFGLFFIDYEVLITISKGSTFINLTENDTKDFRYFGIRRKSTNSLFLSTRREDYYAIEGTTFHFTKDSNGRNEIYSDGPTREEFEVLVSFKYHNLQS